MLSRRYLLASYPVVVFESQRLRCAFGLLDEPGEVAGLLEGPDKLVGVLISLDLNFVGELPIG